MEGLQGPETPKPASPNLKTGLPSSTVANFGSPFGDNDIEESEDDHSPLDICKISRSDFINFLEASGTFHPSPTTARAWFMTPINSRIAEKKSHLDTFLVTMKDQDAEIGRGQMRWEKLNAPWRKSRRPAQVLELAVLQNKMLRKQIGLLRATVPVQAMEGYLAVAGAMVEIFGRLWDEFWELTEELTGIGNRLEKRLVKKADMGKFDRSWLEFERVQNRFRELEEAVDKAMEEFKGKGW